MERTYKKTLEEDNWLDEYQKYFSNSDLCLDLGCYIGQYNKKIMSHGYIVVSADISKISLNVVKEFKNNNFFDFTFPNFFVPYPDSDIYLHPEKYDVTIKNENWNEYQRWQLPRPIIINGMTDQQYMNEIIEINKISMEEYKNENNSSRSLRKKR